MNPIYEHSFKAIKQGVGDFLTQTEIPVRQVYEPAFQLHLLPICLKYLRNEASEEELGKWMNAADGRYHPIQVTDPEGELLFIVPSPYVKIAPVEIQRNNDKAVVTPNDLVSRQDQAIENGDTRKNVQLEQAIAGLFEFDVPVEERLERLYRWAVILDHYNESLDLIFGSEGEACFESLKEIFEEKLTETTNAITVTTEEVDHEDLEF